MNVAYVGNHDPRWSTETHIAKALENLGHQVTRIPEQRLEWLELPRLTEGHDLMLWTRTGGFAPPDKDRQRVALKAVEAVKVGIHLDRWWGLDRETSEGGPRDVEPDPFFTHNDALFTADGGDNPWEVPHYWSPPAILSDETRRGSYNPKYACDVGFVGNLWNYGHAEWQPYRRQLSQELQRYNFRVFPNGARQIRGRELADLYATVPVLIGDSCLVGNPSRYWSDRIPETTGRGGYLIHPDVEGLSSVHPDLHTYPLGDFQALHERIQWALDNPEARRENAETNHAHTVANHTYEHRLSHLVTKLGLT